jgi:membrane-anchored protein YejM (alkaline phosphatase superfamily)
LAAGAQGSSKMPYVLAAAGVILVLALSFAPKLWEKVRKVRRKRVS